MYILIIIILLLYRPSVRCTIDKYPHTGVCTCMGCIIIVWSYILIYLHTTYI